MMGLKLEGAKHRKSRNFARVSNVGRVDIARNRPRSAFPQTAVRITDRDRPEEEKRHCRFGWSPSMKVPGFDISLSHGAFKARAGLHETKHRLAPMKSGRRTARYRAAFVAMIR